MKPGARLLPAAPPRAQRGFLLMTAVVLIVIAALLLSAMVFLSASNTESSAGHTQSAQALFIADSGLDYGQRQLAQDTDWYRDTSDPAIMVDGTCPPSTVTLNLGQGTFTVCTNKPATMLRRRVVSGSTANICVYTVDRFPASGYVQIDDDISAGAEFVHYTGTIASAPGCGNQPALTGIARNQAIGPVTGTMGDHERDIYVYPVTTLQAGGLPNSCTTPSSFQIADNSKFLSAGTIALDDGSGVNYELILYTGSSRSGGVMTLTGVQRCYGGTASNVWQGGFPVTPVTAQTSNPVQFEAEISSVGSVSGTVRMERKTVQR